MENPFLDVGNLPGSTSTASRMSREEKDSGIDKALFLL